MKISKKIPTSAMAFLLCLTIIDSTCEAAVISVASETTGVSASADAKAETKTQSLQTAYFHEEQFSQDHSLTGIASQCTENFEAGDWKISAASIVLRFTATQLADDKLSSITLSLNGSSFYSQRIVSSIDSTAQVLTVKLPIDAIKSGQNSLTVNTYMVTVGCTCSTEGTAEKGSDGCSCCADNNSAAVWMTISKESSIALQYMPKASVSTIADFCGQIVSIDALENKQSSIAVRSDADDTELTTAALVLTGLSGKAKMFYGNLGLQTADNEHSLYSGKYRIYISKYSSLIKSITDSLSEDEKQAAQNGAAMVLLDSQNGSNVLLITGSNNGALVNAAKLIDNSSYLAQIKTAWKSVSADENVLTEKTAIDQYKQLTATGTSLNGRGKHSASFYIAYPANRELSYSSQISVLMRYSENLNFDRSLVTVYVNDKPIGSKSLEKDKAQGDTAVFDIPTDLKVSGNFTVNVLFDLEDDSNCCACVQDLVPWAWISSDSTLKITSENVNTLLFENYPGPFIEDGEFNKAVTVLPDSPGPADLDAMRLILLTMGRSLDYNTGSLRIVHASSIGDVTDSNVISIGRYERNSIAQKNNDKLFFRFSADGTTLSSNEKMLIDSNYGKSLGTVQLLDSPLSKEKRALMVVTGISDEAMLHGVKYIGSTDNVWEIYGDGYVADGMSVFPYRFKIDNEKAQSAVTQLLTRKDIRGVESAAGIVVILALVAIAFMYRKYRKARKEDEK